MAAFPISPLTCFTLGEGWGGAFFGPVNQLSRPVAAGGEVQAQLHYELCHRRALPGTPADYSPTWVPPRDSVGRGSRLIDELLKTSRAWKSVLQLAVEGEETLLHSEDNRL